MTEGLFVGGIIPFHAFSIQTSGVELHSRGNTVYVCFKVTCRSQLCPVAVPWNRSSPALPAHPTWRTGQQQGGQPKLLLSATLPVQSSDGQEGNNTPIKCLTQALWMDITLSSSTVHLGSIPNKEEGSDH